MPLSSPRLSPSPILLVREVASEHNDLNDGLKLSPRSQSSYTSAPQSPPPASSPHGPHSPSYNHEEFERSQVANPIRLPWKWRARGKTIEPYIPKIKGKWWSIGARDLAALTPNKKRDFGHIGRIMETELGERLRGTDKCTACHINNDECWVYSQKGSQQVSRPGDACARCRLVARFGGCSLSKRRKRQPRPARQYGGGGAFRRDILPNTE